MRLRPLIALLNGLSNLVLRHVVRVEPQDEAGAAFTAEQVGDLIAESHREGLLDDDEQQLLARTLRLQTRTASSVLLRLDRLVTVESTATAGAVEELSARTGYPRFPVPDDGRLRLRARQGPDRRRERTGRAGAVAGTATLARVTAAQPLAEVLTAMQASRAHLATVSDEAGRDLGVVALEDVLEELVGQVADATHGSGSRRIAERDDPTAG